jgi:hypothetical protein
VFDLEKLRHYESRFTQLDINLIGRIAGGGEDVSWLICWGDKNKLSGIEELYALACKLDYSSEDGLEAETSFKEYLLDGKFQTDDPQNTFRIIREWKLSFDNFNNNFLDSSGIESAYIIENDPDYSEVVFEDEDRYIFIRISV